MHFWKNAYLCRNHELQRNACKFILRPPIKKNTNRTIYHKHIPAQLTSHVGSISKSRRTRKFIRFIYSYELFNFKLFVISHLCSCGKNCIYEPFKTVLYTSIIKHPILWYVIYCDYVSQRVKKTIINLRLIGLCFHIKTHIFRINFNRDFSFNFFSLRIIFAIEIGIFLFFSVYFSLLLFILIR